MRCGGPCMQVVKVAPYESPEGWRWVESRDPNAPRIEITAEPGQGFTIGPGSNPKIMMCPECAEVAAAAEAN